MNAPRQLTVRHAKPEDLEALLVIEEVSFSMPWPKEVLLRDLMGERGECYWVAVLNEQIVAYIGGWVVGTDFHIGSLATGPAYRRRGIAKLLMLCALQYAAGQGAEMAFLEHRISNRAAAALYEELGFRRLRVRRGYYSDKGEDAVELALSGLQSEATRLRLEQELAIWLRDHRYDVRLTDLECE
ncbi:MAG: ribosomal protein S18-alanine N-acetyltransferase [candidate division WS1 bacterium]|nr:ribosomal protein S18-alanine N-acetyltransferase [candidate division WS1 bacterium]